MASTLLLDVSASAGPQLWPAVAAVAVVVVMLAMFILPDYICWKRRLRNLPSVVAHQIQFVDEATCRQALALIEREPASTRFDKFCEVSRALTKTKKRRAGHDGLLYDGEFQIGTLPQEYEALERALFAYTSEIDSVIGPIQTHADAFHLAYIVSRRDPIADMRREAREKAKRQKGEQADGKQAGGGLPAADKVGDNASAHRNETTDSKKKKKKKKKKNKKKND